MTQATTLRRTYTTARKNDDDSRSSDDSVMISSTSSSASSASESDDRTHSFEKKSIENIIKNTSHAETGKITKNRNQKHQLKIPPYRVLAHLLKMIKKLVNLLKN